MSTETTPAANPAPVSPQEEIQPVVDILLAADTNLGKLTARLADVITQTGHDEMWGVQLSQDALHAPTQVILQKFLRANADNVAAAEKQLTSALEWRKKMQPTSLVTQAFDKKKFEDLGFVTIHKNEAGKETIITWNIYGSVKDNKATFGDVQEFIKWRVALMELSVQQLGLNDIKEPIPENGTDEHQMLQVHDYQSVSFFRMDPLVKAASKETIETFSMAYPELLAHKYFVNVPTIMGWMFGAMKFFLSPATLRKFHPMTSGTSLSTELKHIAATLPQEYGGQGPTVNEGLTVSLIEMEEAPKLDTPAEAADEPKTVPGLTSADNNGATTEGEKPVIDATTKSYTIVDTAPVGSEVATEAPQHIKAA